MKILKPVALGAGAFVYCLLTLHTALADDTEIYVPKDLPADQQVRPNILFILDSSGSMETAVPNSGNRNRNQVMKAVVNNLLDQLKAKEDINVGIMRYNGTSSEQGGRVLTPVQRLTNANADSLKTVVNAIPASDWTPLSETYYEAYRYMAGLTPAWGAASSVASSKSGGNYISPITHSCQKSHIIYVTDGAPTRDVNSSSAIRSLVTNKNTTYTSSTCGNNDGQCLPHLAEYMANQDLFPTPTTFSDPTNRKQTVTSHFVGFALDLPLLKNAAAAGGGKYYTSDNVSGLTDALKSIIVDITAENTSFAAPSVAVSAFNNLGFRNDLYYALFRPAEGARWPGNVKRYRLAKDTSGNPLIVDKNGNAAIDDTTGFFRDSASSFWSNIDGKDVAKGGVAGQLLNPDTRNMLTWTGSDRTPTATVGISGSAALGTLTDGNTAVTSSLLGASNPTERSDFIKWARGKNTDGSARLAVGDVLHNEPKLAAYTTDEDLVRVHNSQKPTTDPAYQASPEQLYMFFGSNEGFIHAINPVNGSEKFAFIPKELLPNPGAYLKDAKGSANKRYGMDGQINLWTEYGAMDAATKTRSISKAYLYAGMRRGGSNYYALDVANINSPALKWLIKGPVQTKQANGSYSNATSGFTPGYDKLGLTYSAPKLAKVKVNGAETKVLIFTGGYDLDQDNVGTNVPKNDDVGNSLFIANAETGQVIWRAGNTGDTGANLQVANMTNSMPADPAIIDIDGNGLVDIIYASDLRGQVFRFDFNNANTGANATGADAFATGGRIANLGGSTAENNRRFFTTPDVALIRERGGKTYFTVSLGSGFRESPLNADTNDRFYVLRDSNVFSKPGSYTSIVESDLVDVSSVNLSDAQATQILADIALLEAQMNSLNQALSTSQGNFTTYKTSLGHTTKQNAAIQAYGDANTKQKQIDDILAADPYLDKRAPNTIQQSILQDSLTLAHDVLAGIEQARAAAQTQADTSQAPADIAAAAALTTQRDRMAHAYENLTSLQTSIDTEFAEILAEEAAITAAKVDPNFDSDTIPQMETDLAAHRADYAGRSDVDNRTRLNSLTPSAIDQLNAVNTALLAGNATDIEAALDNLGGDFDLTTPTSPNTTDVLLARDEASKSAALLTQVNNEASTTALVANLRTEQNALRSAGAGYQAEADALAATLYDPASNLLSGSQLLAAQAKVAPANLTVFDAYQFLIDEALANASNPTTGIPNLRTQINAKYAQLTPGNSYTPNTALLAASKGFYLRLPKGEKVLSTSISFRGAVLFSTFSPRGQATSTCGSDVGRGRTYAMSLLDASAIFTQTISGTKTPVRSFDLKRSGIPPTPSVILSDGKPTFLTGTEVLDRECVDGVEACRAGDAVKATYWREN